jgi:5-methylcytosine-specific restriction enzyme subunit McrC
MGRLYELFVAEWLQEHLPDDYRLVAQESVSLNSELGVGLIIDLVIYDRAGNVPLMVLDTKYKTPRSPSPNDRDQIIAYAAAVGCRDAILIYPDMPEQPFDGRFGASTIHLRTMQFGIEGDLEEAGVQFLEKLLVNLHY